MVSYSVKELSVETTGFNKAGGPGADWIFAAGSMARVYPLGYR